MKWFRERRVEPVTRQVNWWWFLGCESAGALLIGLAFLLEAWYGWQGVSESALVNAGSAVILAGVLFFVTPRFLRNVGQIATEAATAVADARIDESTKGLQVRLDELAGRMNDLLHTRDAVHDEAVRSIDIPSLETIGTALAKANELGR